MARTASLANGASPCTPTEFPALLRVRLFLKWKTVMVSLAEAAVFSCEAVRAVPGVRPACGSGSPQVCPLCPSSGGQVSALMPSLVPAGAEES